MLGVVQPYLMHAAIFSPLPNTHRDDAQGHPIILMMMFLTNPAARPGKIVCSRTTSFPLIPTDLKLFVSACIALWEEGTCSNIPKSLMSRGLAYLQTLAEKAAWEISKKEGFELVVINPTFVLGKAPSALRR